MASPTSPTLADLEYAYYAANTLAAFPLIINVADSTTTSEKMTPNFVGFTNSVTAEDFSVTAENIGLALDPTGPSQFSIVVSDTSVTSENVTVPNPGDIVVSDSTVTSEHIVVAEA